MINEFETKPAETITSNQGLSEARHDRFFPATTKTIHVARNPLSVREFGSIAAPWSFRQVSIGLAALYWYGMLVSVTLAQDFSRHPQQSLVRYFEVASGDIVSLHECERICLVGVPLSVDQLSRLARNKRIRALDLQGCALPSQEPQQIFQARQLEELSLAGASIRNEHLKLCIQSPFLKHLDLRGTGITDDGFHLLSDCRSLISLDLRGTSVTADAVREMQRRRPDLEILFFPTDRGRLAHQTIP